MSVQASRMRAKRMVSGNRRSCVASKGVKKALLSPDERFLAWHSGSGSPRKPQLLKRASENIPGPRQRSSCNLVGRLRNAIENWVCSLIRRGTEFWP
ncbi:hypothetical protein MRB53_038221 [Persea americana]|nr:hypothetical protein MRB53_038221 [Persea americana]